MIAGPKSKRYSRKGKVDIKYFQLVYELHCIFICSFRYLSGDPLFFLMQHRVSVYQPHNHFPPLQCTNLAQIDKSLQVESMEIMSATVPSHSLLRVLNIQRSALPFNLNIPLRTVLVECLHITSSCVIKGQVYQKPLSSNYT